MGNYIPVQSALKFDAYIMFSDVAGQAEYTPYKLAQIILNKWLNDYQKDPEEMLRDVKYGEKYFIPRRKN